MKILFSLFLISFYSLSTISQCSLIQNYMADTIIIPQGDSVNLTVSINTPVSYTASTDSIQWIPDGAGYSFTDTLNVSGFLPNETIINGSDICYLCMNIEHSYMGDLKMMLTCPNNSSIVLMDEYAGAGPGSTFLGDAYDNNQSTTPGIGFVYCFDENALWGTMVAENINGNYSTSTITPGQNILKSGSYLPEQSYSNLVGCPLNGNWILTIIDNVSLDDGYLFNWRIQLKNCNNLASDTVYTQWSSNNVVLDSNSSTTIIADTSAWYFISAQDSLYGCIEEDSIYISVIEIPQGGIIGDTIVESMSSVSYYTPYNSTNTYYWSVYGGNILTGQGTNQINVGWGPEDSTAYVSLLINDSLPFTQFDTLNVNVVVGLDINEIDSQKILLFPNPAKEMITISCNNCNNNYILNIINTNGEVSLQKTINSNMSNQIIDISSLSNGIYYIQLISNANEFFIKKLIVE